MSLFKSRTFWATNAENAEFFDQNCLIVTKLNSDSDYIVTVSHSGIIRIFKPSTELQENHLTGFKATDLLVEKQFESPILQVGSGRLVSGSSNIQIAILQAHLLSVFALIIKEGATDHGTQSVLQLLYEHKLRRSGFSLTIGPFGGTQNRDFVCVQTLDGMLSFFEQESFGFCCFLPNTLLPTIVVFVSKSDSFVTCDSNWILVSFKYKSLSEAGQNSNQSDEMGKKLVCEWNYNLGETVIDLEVVDDVELKETWILVLGERNLFCLSHNGNLRYMKKLDYSPVCFTNYILDNKIMSLLVSETNTLLIYQNTTLKWSSRLDILPVSIKRAFFKNIKGVLVVLSEEGQLECCYLGTEPSLFVTPPLTTQNFDFDKAALELASLDKIIKKSHANDTKFTNTSSERELNVIVTVDPHLEPCKFDTTLSGLKMCLLSVEIIPSAPFEQVQIAIKVAKPLKVEPQIAFFTNLTENRCMKSHVFLYENYNVPSLKVDIVVSFVSNLGVPRCITKCAMLPLNLLLETCAPHKESEHKVTLNINQNMPGLYQLFPEFVGANLNTASNAIAFKTLADGIVTVLPAKSTQRYRLQSDCFPSLSLLIEQMIYRLGKYFSNTSEFSLTYNSTLPISETLLLINKHFVSRQKYNSLQLNLIQLCAQFRLIQKRLISKFKTKNPTPLTNLELLLQDTFNEILTICEKLEEETNNLIKAQNQLSCALTIVVNLTNIMDINSSIKALVESTFSPNICDLEGQNWEDVTDAALCYLLRTILAKSEKDKLRATNTNFEEVKDLSKFEKHFSQVLERVSKYNEVPENLTIEEEPEKAEESTLSGRKIGEDSSRLLSARRRQKTISNFLDK